MRSGPTKCRVVPGARTRAGTGVRGVLPRPGSCVEGVAGPGSRPGLGAPFVLSTARTGVNDPCRDMSHARTRRPMLLALVYGVFLVLVGITASALVAVSTLHVSRAMLDAFVSRDGAIACRRSGKCQGSNSLCTGNGMILLPVMQSKR